jgi:hypothetical protein
MPLEGFVSLTVFTINHLTNTERYGAVPALGEHTAAIVAEFGK